MNNPEQSPQSEFEDIKKKMFKQKQIGLAKDLCINRVPIDTFNLFKQKAIPFAGDYGQLLKSMVDKLFVEPQMIDSVMDVINTEVIPAINALADRVEVIENSLKEKSEQTVRRSIDGKRKILLSNRKE